MDIFYYADFYALGLLLVFQTIFVIRAVRGGGSPRGRRLASAWAYFFGTFVTVSMALHNAEIVWRIIPGTVVSHGAKPVYDFRFYGLLLFGTLMLIEGARMMKAARLLAFGDASACFLLRRQTLIVLALCVPLIPIHVFASVTTILGVLNLGALAFAREKSSGAFGIGTPNGAANALTQ